MGQKSPVRHRDMAKLNPLQEQLLKAGLAKKSKVAEVAREQHKSRQQGMFAEAGNDRLSLIERAQCVIRSRRYSPRDGSKSGTISGTTSGGPYGGHCERGTQEPVPPDRAGE